MRPHDLPFSFLEDITDQFSEKQKLGTGGYGEVYKGVDKNGKEIAVKKLNHEKGLDNKHFDNEFSNLTKVQHQNIVRLVGYCYEVRHIPFKQNEEYFLCKVIDRVLCLEYLQRGSLDRHLFEEHSGLDWPTRYRIIKGICEGLNYLHGGMKDPILHLDLKPTNILLDNNMVPKIADFGLSRLFGEPYTHTTKVCIGTEYYMPPEYLTARKITNKYDVFSLGIIIMQIMTGPMGYSKYGEMSSPQQFVELVHKNWRERIEATSKYTEHDCQQVKKCIEIALSCVEPDRNNRPAVREIIHELRKTETNGSASFWDQDRVAKIGQWGGVGGGCRDIEAVPHHLESLIIGSGAIIYSLEFSYIDHRGKRHTAGPWGGHGPHKASNHHKIQLGLSEYLLEISGTIGPFDVATSGVITSLTFITNACIYGPFGEIGGTPFKIPVQSHGNIIGFYARAGWYFDSFGVYVKPKPETKDEEGKEEVGIVKIGPWGGNGGNLHDIKVKPRHLESVTIHSGLVVNSLEFSYNGQDGKKHTVGPWGSPAESTFTIEFRPLEFLTGVYGTTGLYGNVPSDVVTSLTLVTNARSYGPFGQGSGIPFQIPTRGNGSILGFFGRASLHVHAIGVYVNPLQEGLQPETGLAKIGPWGGIGGIAHYMDDTVEPKPHRLESVTIRCDIVIHSLEFQYSDHHKRQHTVGPWGGPGGNYCLNFRLEPLEFVQGITGTFGPFGTSGNVITSLTFATNQGRAYGPFGVGGGTPFSIRAGRDGCIVGFFARAGLYLKALGAYVHTY